MGRPDPHYAGLAFRTLARELLWLATCRHEQGAAPNILLFATRRGGSTFAMELIAANRGIRSLDQPLSMQNPTTTPAQLAEIPRFHQGQITSVDDETSARLERLMERIARGDVVINAPVRVWRRDVPLRSDRLVLKIVDAKPVIDWFHHHVDGRIVYLTRHPIPQSLSCIRNRWTLTVDAHLRDPVFVERHVPDAALALARDTLRTGSPLRKFVVNWALENAAPMQLLPERPEWLHIRYEDCVGRPHAVLEEMAARLDLTDLDRMRAVLTRPSVSSGISTAEARRGISAGRGAAIAEAWRSQVDQDDQRWCTEALEAFGFDPEVLDPQVP